MLSVAISSLATPGRVFGFQTDAGASSSEPPDAVDDARGQSSESDGEPASSTVSASDDAASPSTPPSLPADLTPYRIQIGVVFENDARLSSRFREQFLRDLDAAIHRVMGRMWSPAIETIHWLTPTGAAGLAQLTAEDFTTRTSSQTADQVIVLTVSVEGNRFQVAARQWDWLAQDLGPLRVRETLDRRMVAADAFSVVHMVFEPQATVIDVDDEGGVTMLLRAGELYPSDPDVAQVATGSLLQPYFRYLDRDFELRQIQSVPWTYLRVDEIDVSELKCTPISGIRSPITKSRRRVEVVASLIQPDLPETVLKLVPFRNPNKPLVGIYVDVLTEPPTRGETPEKKLELLSGRNGEVTIPADSKHVPLWIQVRSGNSILARVPFIPGVDPFQLIELPDDSERLRVEGQLATLQGELIDTVARRAILLSLVRSLAESGDWKNFDQQMAALQKLPETRQFESRLTAIRVPAVESARKRRDRAAESRINKLCDRTAELIQRFLDPRELQLVREEIRELLRRREQAKASEST